jgi:hypothetical protein
MAIIRGYTAHTHTNTNSIFYESLYVGDVSQHILSIFHHYKKNKGPDNPTCQLLPTSSKRKVKMAREIQEREKRW